ncbi:MAG: cobalamin B12-binding domain-containing protein [Syntrophobacteraceae bacterium]
MNAQTAKKNLLECIMSGNRTKAIDILDGWAKRFNYGRAVSDILEPVLEDIGNLWMGEKISLAAGYLAGKIAEETLLHAHEHEDAVPETRGPVVIGNVEDDYHGLGRRMVCIFLKTAGWSVVDLGNDVAASDFVDSALANGSKIIAVSSMMFTTAGNIINIRREIDKRDLSDRIRLAVGGAVFKIRPGLVAEVGGDGTAANAVGAPELMERLWR